MSYRRIAHAIGLLVLLALVFPFVLYAVPGAIGADHSFVVLSGSMEPELAPGDVVIVEETEPETIEEGDVITFSQGGETPVTHRVIDVRDENGTTAFQTQGDANPEPDAELVTDSDLLGAVVVTIPLIGHVIQFTNTTSGFALLVGLPIGLLVLSEVWNLLTAVRQESATSSGTPKADPLEPAAGTGSEAVSDGENDEVTIQIADLTATVGLLVLGVPYTTYVAIQLRTTVSFIAAFAAWFSLLGAGGLWLWARVAGDGDE